MIHEVHATGMHNRAYYHRYTDDNVDLCDVLSSFSYGAKMKLDELSRIMGLPGKQDGIDGSQVESYFNAGRIQEIASPCASGSGTVPQFAFTPDWLGARPSHAIGGILAVGQVPLLLDRRVSQARMGVNECGQREQHGLEICITRAGREGTK